MKNYLLALITILGFVAIGYYFYWSKNVYVSQEKKVHEFLIKNECYTLGPAIQKRIGRGPTIVEFQCFNLNKNLKVQVYIESESQQERLYQFDLNNPELKVSDLNERIILIGAPKIYKENCKKGIGKYCNIFKYKPIVFTSPYYQG